MAPMLRAFLTTATAAPLWLVLTSLLTAFLTGPSNAQGQASQDGAAVPTKLLRYPDLHGNTVVFVYGGDLWTAEIPVTAGTTVQATRLTSDDGMELFPRFSPDGKWIAFTGQIDGDEQVYVIPSTGGEPKQLTFYPAAGPLPDRWGFDHQVYGWTPDGNAIVFRSVRRAWGLTDCKLYTVSPKGGLPMALPMPVAGSGAVSPDSTKIAYSPLFRDFRTWKRYEGGWAQDLWLFDLKTNTAENFTDHPRTDRDPMWVGNAVFFASDRTGTLNLFRYEPASKTTDQETFSSTWDVRWPEVAGPGDARIIYELAGQLQVFDCNTKESTGLNIVVPDEGLWARPSIVAAKDRLETIALAPGGKRAAVTARGELFSVPLEHGPTRNLTDSPGAHDKGAVWSPDGKTIAWISDQSGEEQVWLRDAKGEGVARQLTRNLVGMLHSPEWAPDSSHIAFGDKDGRLMAVDVADGKLLEIDQTDRGRISDHAWSPCSGWLAWSKTGANGNDSLYLWSRGTGTVTRITDGMTDEAAPVWSADGERLFFAGWREFAPRLDLLEWDFLMDRATRVFALALRRDLGPLFPERSDEAEIAADTDDDDDGGDSESEAGSDETDKPDYTQIDLEGLAQRVEPVPGPADNWYGLSAVKGHLFAVRRGGSYYGRGSDSSPSLHRFSIEERKWTKLADSGSYLLSPCGKHLAVNLKGSWTVCKVDGKPGDGKAFDLGGMKATKDPRQEWPQIFAEVWRRYRDYFYVENMHGYDWEALREQYRPLLDHVRHRQDLNYVIGEMIGELNVGHAYIAGGEWERPDRVPVALPGAVFERDAKAGRYRIARILPGRNDLSRYRSPLTEVGVNVQPGDYVLAIDGEPLVGNDNPYRLLRGRISGNGTGRQVTFTVNAQPSMEGAREVSFEPLSDESALHYLDMVETNRRKVAEMSAGKLGYIHIPDMGAQGIQEFIRTWYPQLEKDGIVVDVRSNGGGNVSQMLIERMLRPMLMAEFGRTSGFDTYPNKAFLGHLIAVLDEDSASDGDIFPAMFRKAGLGQLVGKRSWGGIIGITNRGTLIDGGSVNVPEFGNTGSTGGGWAIEGVGVPPDVEVENDPASLLAGKDPQLETAVELLLQKVAAEPVVRPTRPEDPVKTGR